MSSTSQAEVEVPSRTTVSVVPARIPGVAVAASMVLPGFGQLYANSILFGVLFFVVWTVPVWLIVGITILSGMDLAGGLAQPPVVRGPAEGDGDFGDEAYASPFAWVGDVLGGFRVGVIIYLLIWIAAVVHAYFAAKKFNRKNETVVK